MKNKAAAWMLLLLLVSLASCASGTRSSTQTVTARSILEDQRRQEAELRSEASGPSMAPSDYKRLMVALAFKRERGQREAAQFAKFQMDQKIALAEASSPKMVIAGGDVPSNYRQVDFGNARGYREVSSFRGGSNRGAYSAVNPAQGQHYPARFYQRQVQEDSATQAETAFNENAATQQQQGDPDAPYAIPVPGRPGYVTMPPKMGGYIDVRGYAPGAFVMDPWTKTIIRVP